MGRSIRTATIDRIDAARPKASPPASASAQAPRLSRRRKATPARSRPSEADQGGGLVAHQGLAEVDGDRRDGPEAAGEEAGQEGEKAAFGPSPHSPNPLSPVLPPSSPGERGLSDKLQANYSLFSR